MIGDGQVNWPDLLREAQRAGLKHYFIEDVSVDAIDQIPLSLRFLEAVKYKVLTGDAWEIGLKICLAILLVRSTNEPLIEK